jgi:2,4-dienoyl-CoA reductase-like NADH-dependent reductase (Old Yellow Enzyme family)
MSVFQDPKLYGLETMTLDQQIERLTFLCKSEAGRRRLYPHTYHYARHLEYSELLKRAMAKRDIEKIDQAFERAAERILEAAE